MSDLHDSHDVRDDLWRPVLRIRDLLAERSDRVEYQRCPRSGVFVAPRRKTTDGLHGEALRAIKQVSSQVAAKLATGPANPAEEEMLNVEIQRVAQSIRRARLKQKKQGGGDA